MKKDIIYREECPNLKQVMEEFCKAKKAVYEFSPEEFEKKVENFYKNVQSIQFLPSTLMTSIKGQQASFCRKNGNIVLRGNKLNLKQNKLDNITMQGLIHELNHAWNYEKGKRLGIISKPLKISKLRQYKYIMEAINEAETQILCSKELKQDNPGYIPNEQEFSGYREYESPIFQTLCTVCNQSGIEFLKSIEGMTQEEIISHIANKTGYSIENSKTFFEELAESSINIKKDKRKISSKISKDISKELLKQSMGMLKRNVKDVDFDKIDKIIDETLNTIQVPSRISKNL